MTPLPGSPGAAPPAPPRGSMTRREALRVGAAGALLGMVAPRPWRDGPREAPAPSSLPVAPPPTDALFDQALLHDARLDLDPGDWRALRAAPESNHYYPADFSADGEVVRNVGIRSRGDGSRIGQKPCLKVDFNRYVKGQSFHGMKSLVLDNLAEDETGLHERLALAVFEAMGIAAPRYAHARLTLNGGYGGVYGLVEPVRKPFLRSRFGESGGNLFGYEYETEPEVFYDFSYRGEDAKAYVPRPFRPRTHKRAPETAGLVAFLRTLNQAPQETLGRELSAHLDVDQFVTYYAVENALADGDGFGGESGRNNFYLYQPAGGGRFVFIPWDKDMALERADWPLYRTSHLNVLTHRVLADPAWRKTYAQRVAQAVDSFVNARWLGPRLELAYHQIREAFLADSLKPYSSTQFEYGVKALRLVIQRRETGILNSAGW